MPAFFPIYIYICCTHLLLSNCGKLWSNGFGGHHTHTVTSRDDAVVIEFCQERGLLRKRVHCSTCQRDYSLIKRKSDTRVD